MSRVASPGRAGREVERDRHRWKLSLVSDGQRSAGWPEVRESRQRHCDLEESCPRQLHAVPWSKPVAPPGSCADGGNWPMLGDDVDALQRVGCHLVLRVDLQHDVILVQRLVDGRNLALSESVVQNVVDLLGSDSQSRSGIAIDDDVLLQAADLLVAVDVLEYGNRPQLLRSASAPMRTTHPDPRQKRVLILGVGQASANLQILRGLEKQRRSRHMRSLRTKAIDHLVDADLAFIQRLQGDEHAGLVLRCVAAGEGNDVVDRGILFTMRMNSVTFSRIPRTPCPGHAMMVPIMRPVSCCGKKPLGTIMYR